MVHDFKKFGFLWILLTIGCGPHGDMAEIVITATPDPSYTYIDESTGMRACKATIRIEEKGGVGVSFTGETIQYIDKETGTIFRNFTYTEDDIKEMYGSNYLPGGAWVEIEIIDLTDVFDPPDFYVKDTLHCIDDKGHNFPVTLTRTCLHP